VRGAECPLGSTAMQWNLSVSRRAYGDVEQDLEELRRTLNQ